jgi:hypothetical protein
VSVVPSALTDSGGEMGACMSGVPHSEQNFEVRWGAAVPQLGHDAGDPALGFAPSGFSGTEEVTRTTEEEDDIEVFCGGSSLTKSDC